MAFGRRCIITPQAGKVTGTLTDFTVPIDITDNELKLIGNGGLVTQKEEIRVFSDAALTVAAPFERVKYDGTLGRFSAHAKVPSLAVGGPYFLGFQDPALVTDLSSSAAWPSEYKAVYHLDDGTTLSGNDSTSNAAHGTVTAATAVAGQFNGGASFNGTTAKIVSGSATMPGNEFTLMGWWNASTFSGIHIFTMGDSTDADQVLRMGGTNQMAIVSYYTNNATSDVFAFGGAGLSTSTLYHVAWVRSTTHHTMYINGVQYGSPIAVGHANAYFGGGTKTFQVGTRGGFAFFGGMQDEWSVAAAVRSAAWIEAVRNAQLDPAAFATYAFGDPSDPIGGGRSHHFYYSGAR